MVGAASGASFIVAPAIEGLLSIDGLSTLGFAATALNGINLLFALLFMPKSNHSIQMFATSDDGYWRRLAVALTKPLLGAVFTVLFFVTLAFSVIPVIVPFLGIVFFSFSKVEMSYFFMYIGMVQIVLQGFLIGRLTKRWREENLIVLGSVLMMFGVFFVPLTPTLQFSLPLLCCFHPTSA